MQKFSPIRRAAAVASGVAVAALLTTGAATVTASAPQAPIPFPCTGSPLDSATTCALYGHDGSDRGDASGGDTPNLGGGGGGTSLQF
jgi:hypothetical protein